MKKPTVSKLKKVLDKVFSEYVRKRHQDHRTNIMCVSCRKWKHYDEMQAGHYVGRAHLNTRWDLRNVWPQCVACNVFLKGNYPAYTKFLLEQYGEQWLQELIEDGKKIRKFTVMDLQNEIEKFKRFIKEV